MLAYVYETFDAKRINKYCVYPKTIKLPSLAQTVTLPLAISAFLTQSDLITYMKKLFRVSSILLSKGDWELPDTGWIFL